jgi:hypothetical protein
MKTLAILTATVLALVACGGGGDTSSTPPTDAATILGYLDATNVTNTSSPSNVQFSGVVKHWKLHPRQDQWRAPCSARHECD